MQLTSKAIRSLTAIVAGLGTFALSGALRAQLQDSLSPEPWLGLTLTVLTYVIPGAVTGAIIARRSFVPGSVLGALTLPVVLIFFGGVELRFAPPGLWYKPILTWFLLGVLLCSLGSLLGAWLRGSTQRKQQAQWSQ